MSEQDKQDELLGRRKLIGLKAFCDNAKSSAPKPIEPAKVEAGDHIVHVHEKVGEGLPPLDYTDEDLAEEIRNASYGVNVAGQLSCRTRQLKASLQRERELVDLLKEVQSQAGGYGWGHFGLYRGKTIVISESQLERINAAVTAEKVSSR